MKDLWAVVLAAGEGKRMHSSLPKVLHRLCGRPMLQYILDSAVELTDRVLIVVGHGASHVQEVVGNSWRYVLQEQQLGTGHAVKQALPHLPQEGTLLVLCGDTPLMEADHLKGLLDKSRSGSAVVATTVLPDPAGYGRIIRDQHNLVKKIVEEKDASEEEKKVTEINTGTYCFDLKLLKSYVPRLTADNEQKEFYLTDVIALMYRDGYNVGAYYIEDRRVGLGINNRVQLAEATAILQKRINHHLMLKGVTIVDPDTTCIDYDVQIAKDTVIRPHCVIESGTVIGASCSIGPGSHLHKAVIEDEAVVVSSTVIESNIESGLVIGPYAHIKANQRKR